MADVLLISVFFLGSLLLMYAMGIPVAIAMGVSCMLMWIGPFGLSLNYQLISSNLFYGVNSFPLLAIPFYVLLGRLMNRAGMTERIFRFAASIVGQFRGGIAHVNILASMLFSGMSGLAVADAAGLGRIEYQAMRDHGYDKRTAIGVTGSSTLIGPLIPPSVAIIVYAVIAEQSIGQLFLGGLVPGILMGFSLMVFVVLLSIRKGYESEQSFEWVEFWESFKASSGALFIPIIIIGGILWGIFTPTEAGAIAVVYILIVGGVIYNEFTLSDLLNEIRYSMVETCALTFIIGIATLYGFVALQLELPILLVESITGFSQDPQTIMLILVALFLIVGTFMETAAAITVLVPILLPLLKIAQIDLVYFGVIMLLTLLLGLLTPPFGIILFVLEKVTDVSLEEIMRAVLPYYIPILAVLLLCLFFPELITYVPYQLMG